MPKSDDTHKAQIEEARKLFTGLGWPYWLFSQGHVLRGSTGIPDMFFLGAAGIESYTTQTLDHLGRLRDSGAVNVSVPCWWEAKANVDKEKPAQRQFKRLVQAAGNPVLTGRVGEISRFFGLDRRTT